MWSWYLQWLRKTTEMTETASKHHDRPIPRCGNVDLRFRLCRQQATLGASFSPMMLLLNEWRSVRNPGDWHCGLRMPHTIYLLNQVSRFKKKEGSREGILRNKTNKNPWACIWLYVPEMFPQSFDLSSFTCFLGNFPATAKHPPLSRVLEARVVAGCAVHLGRAIYGPCRRWILKNKGEKKKTNTHPHPMTSNDILSWHKVHLPSSLSCTFHGFSYIIGVRGFAEAQLVVIFFRKFGRFFPTQKPQFCQKLFQSRNRARQEGPVFSQKLLTDKTDAKESAPTKKQKRTRDFFQQNLAFGWMTWLVNI